MLDGKAVVRGVIRGPLHLPPWRWQNCTNNVKKNSWWSLFATQAEHEYRTQSYNAKFWTRLKCAPEMCPPFRFLNTPLVSCGGALTVILPIDIEWIFLWRCSYKSRVLLMYPAVRVYALIRECRQLRVTSAHGSRHCVRTTCPGDM